MASKRQTNHHSPPSNSSGNEIVLDDDSEEKHEKKIHFFVKITSFPGFGIICTLLCALFYSMNSLIVKLLPGLHPAQITLSRAYIQCLFCIPMLFHKRNEIDILGPSGYRVLLWAHGIVAGFAVVFLYISVSMLSLGNAITLSYLSVILAPIMARIFLKESLTVFDIIFAVFALVGVVLIARPTFLFPLSEGEQPPTNGIGVLFALTSATLQATGMIMVRKLGRETSAYLVIFYFSFCMALCATVFLIVLQGFRFPCVSELPFVFALGIVGLLAVFFVVLAIQYERAAIVSVLKSTEIIIVYVFQVAILGDIPTALSLAGAALVFSSSVGIGIRKIVNEMKKRRSPARETSTSKT